MLEACWVPKFVNCLFQHDYRPIWYWPNSPSAQSGHKVRNHTCWDARCTLGLPINKATHSNPPWPAFGLKVSLYCTTCLGMCSILYHVTGSHKGLVSWQCYFCSLLSLAGSQMTSLWRKLTAPQVISQKQVLLDHHHRRHHAQNSPQLCLSGSTNAKQAI